MNNGWTGGQYSFVRAILGAYLCVQLVSMIGRVDSLVSIDAALIAIGAIAALFVAVGFRDRIAALVCLFSLGGLVASASLHGNGSLPILGWILLLHITVQPAPYGSAAARGRIDPAGDWTLPTTVFAASWFGMMACSAFMHPLTIVFAPLALSRHARPSVWLAMTLLQLALLVSADAAGASGALLILYLFTFDPAWIRRTRSGSETLFFDGQCGLCHLAVRFLLAESPCQSSLRFAPLFGETYRDRIPTDANLPDSLAVATSDGQVLVRSEAALHLAARLGGYWRILGIAVSVVPRRITDWIYDRIANVRHRLFRKPTEACPILPEALRERLLP